MVSSVEKEEVKAAKRYKVIKVWLKETSQPVVIRADSTYTKGPFYCVLGMNRELVYKYPVQNIWRVDEEY